MKRYIQSLKVIGQDLYLPGGGIFPLIKQTDINTSITTSITVHESANHTYQVEEYDADAVLTDDDFRKIHRMDVTGGDRIFTLPDISSGHQGEWVILIRKGLTNTLQISPAGTDVIFNSDAGSSGALECTDTDHNYSSILLVVVDDGVWGNPSFGIWSTR